MTIKEQITVESFMERIAHFTERYNKLVENENDNFLAYESLAYDLIAELEKDIKENNRK